MIVNGMGNLVDEEKDDKIMSFLQNLYIILFIYFYLKEKNIYIKIDIN